MRAAPAESRSAGEKSDARTAHVVLVLVVAVALFVALAAVMMPFVPDGAYISFRYAEQLAQAQGFTFNSGADPVEGYGSFLWVVLSAVIHNLGLDIPHTAPYASLVFGVLNIVILWAIYRRRHPSPYGLLLPLVLFASSAPLLTFAVSGMETTLYSFLLLLTIYFLDRALSSGALGAYLMTAVVCVILSLCRLEGILVFPVAVLYVMWSQLGVGGVAAKSRHQRGVFIAAVVFIVGVAVYHSWRLAYFGSWLPTTFWAAAGDSLFESWTGNVRSYFVSHGHDYPPMGYYYLAVALLAVIGAGSSGAAAHVRVNRVCLMLGAAFGVLYVGFADPLPGLRYHTAFLGLLFVPLIHLPDAAAKAAYTDLKRVGHRWYWPVVACLLIVSGSWLASTKLSLQRIEDGTREARVKFGRWLNEAVADSTVLAIGEVGSVPYHAKLPVFDMAGPPLVNDPATTHGFSENAFFESMPGVVVFVSKGLLTRNVDPAHERLMTSTRFGDRYEFLATVRLDWYQDRSYWVYVPRIRPHFSPELRGKFPSGLGSVVVKPQWFR